jgi:hypothetical protein
MMTAPTITLLGLPAIWGVTEKSAASRRDFLALMLRNTLGGAAAGTAYKAGLRPLTKNLSHEVASADVIRGATAGPFAKPVVGEADMAAWDAARKQVKDQLHKGVDWGGNPPGKQIANAMNRAGYSALSEPGALAAKKRFAAREATKGAIGGGALGGLSTAAVNLLQHFKKLTKQSSTVNSCHFLAKTAAAKTPTISFDRSLYPTESERLAMQPSAVPAMGIAGAGVGGIGGAAVGGLVGAGRAMFDGEDDGIASLLKKIFSGAATGGLVGGVMGAGVGGGATALRRNSGENKLAKMEDWRRALREYQLNTASKLTEQSDAP